MAGTSNSAFSTPRRKRSTSPHPLGVGLSLSLGSLPRRGDELDVAGKMRLYAQPLMEIVTLGTGQDYVGVRKECELDSPAVLNARLQRGTRLRVLEVQKLKGLKRAHIVLVGEKAPVGWITIGSKDGSHPVVRAVYARPLYEVVSPPLVRKQFETCSTEVCVLQLGTKLQVVESRRSSDGAQRVQIVLLGHDKPMGWITARKRPGQQTGWVSIREVAADDPLLFSPGASPPGSRPNTSRGRSKSPRNVDGWLRGLSISAGSHASFAQAIAQARAKDKWTGISPATSPRTPTPRRSPVGSPRNPAPSIFNKESYLKEREAASIAAAASSTAEAEEAAGGAEKKDGKATAGDAAAAKGKPTAGAATPGRQRREDGDGGPLLKAAELEDVLKLCQEKVAFEEAKLDPSLKSVSVLIGEALVGINVRQLVLIWAKRGPEPLNKLEFRQHVRKLLEKPDSKQIDALFESLDDDGGGTLDVQEIGGALKKVQSAAAQGARLAEGIQEKINRLQSLTSLAQEALDSTMTLEHLGKRVQELSGTQPVSSRLGAQILAKRMKASDVIQKWDANGDGELDKGEFRHNVKALGVAAESKDIDELFDSLCETHDKTGTGVLGVTAVRGVLVKLIDEATAADKNIKDLTKSAQDQSKVARAAQVTFKRQKRIDDAITDKAEEAERKEAEAKAAAAAEAKAIRLAAAAERKAAAAAAKAAFDAKVAAKRSDSFG